MRSGTINIARKNLKIYVHAVYQMIKLIVYELYVRIQTCRKQGGDKEDRKQRKLKQPQRKGEKKKSRKKLKTKTT